MTCKPEKSYHDHSGLANILVYALVISILLFTSIAPGYATPPEYKSYKRSQIIDHTPPAGQCMRIWILYIGQGDAILIQLPKRSNNSPNCNIGQDAIDILVDGGPSGRQLLVFLRALYPESATIEHVVLTHHDGDHVNGLTALLKDGDFGVGTIYHNGLATWKIGGRGFNFSGSPDSSQAVFKDDKGLGLLEDDGLRFQRGSLIDNLDGLRAASSESETVGEYQKFAQAVVTKERPAGVSRYVRTHYRGGIMDTTAESNTAVNFQALWPRKRPRKYKDWGYTINGNSVTFKLTYKNFSMLFTGDQNDESEQDMLNALDEDNRRNYLQSDILKVPHHGSKHVIESFYDAVKPVVSIASMGSRGFRMDWKHPSTIVISWLGGAHRVYHTFIHERRFVYEHMTSEAARKSMIEEHHVLVETDGKWFRIVEVKDPSAIPGVRETRRGNGTRWIKAK